MKISNLLKKTTVASITAAALINTCYSANYFPNTYGKGVGLICCPHWYIGGNLGISHAFDNPFAGTTDYVEHSGTGWSVDTGYQFLHIYGAMIGAELGYTYYADSREYTRTSPPVTVGRTEHQSVDLVATLQLPVVYNFSLLGKLGGAYNYARKNAYPINISRSANNGSIYYGGGVMYNVTKAAAIVGQWNRSRGNSSTGTTDLYSIGVQINLA